MENAIPDEYLQIIRKHYPAVSPQDVLYLSGGNDHFVFVVNQETLFRFPKQAGEVRHDIASFVNQFAQVSPVFVPTIQLYSDAPSGISYEVSPFVKGVSFYPEIARRFTRLQIMEVGQQLGQFLSALHSFPLEQARTMSVNEMDPSLFWLYMHEVAYPYCERVLTSHISKRTHDWIRELFATYIAEIRTTPFRTRVTHSDIWVFHIIVDPERHTLSGVIDFRLRIADPANDFKAFEHYGPDMVKAVYASYNLPIDGSFEMRRLFYTGHDMVFVLARAIEEGNAEAIKLAEVELARYIEAHPNPLASS